MRTFQRILTPYSYQPWSDGGRGSEPTKIAIGYPPATDFLAAYVAKEKGIFAKHNIDATMVKIPVVNNIPSAVVAGSIQIGMTTIPTLLQADDGGLNLVMVAGAARHTKAHPIHQSAGPQRYQV